MKPIKLYSPNGGGSVKVPPHDVDFLKKKGWTEKPVSKTTKKVKENGND